MPLQPLNVLNACEIFLMVLNARLAQVAEYPILKCSVVTPPKIVYLPLELLTFAGQTLWLVNVGTVDACFWHKLHSIVVNDTHIGTM
jgi:hypothetical protein